MVRRSKARARVRKKGPLAWIRWRIPWRSLRFFRAASLVATAATATLAISFLVRAWQLDHGASYQRSPAKPHLRKSGGGSCSQIYALICQQERPFNDPTGSVLTEAEAERRTHLMREQIVADHPKWNEQRVNEALVELIYTPPRRARLEAVFDFVKAAISRWISINPQACS